ncbi:Polysaccharide biosynthesis protein [uncultured archaeon]|nr:Polysaccharide biosynthesis protein [uncultured archaeon]
MPERREALGRRSARTFSVLTLGRLFSLLVGIASVIIIARMLGPAEYGIYTLAFGFYALVSATGNFGFGVYLAKYLAEYEDARNGKMFGSALTSSFLSVAAIGAALMIAGILASGYVAGLFPGSNSSASIFVIASVAMFFSMLYGTSDYAMIGMGKNAAAVVMETGENLVLIVASVLLIQGGFGAAGAMYGLLISYVVAGVLGTLYVFKESVRQMHIKLGLPSMAEVKHSFRYSMPVAANNALSNGIIGFGTLLLGAFVTSSVLGNYGIANKARGTLALFYTTAAMTFLPALSISVARDAGKKGEKEGGRLERVYNKVLLYSMMLTVPMMVYIAVFAMPLTYLFITHAFISAPLYLTLMAAGTIVGLIGTYTANLFMAVGKTTKLLHYSVISAAVQLVALVALTAAWSTIGNIVALFFIGSLVSNWLLIRGAKKSLGVSLHYGKLLRTFASNAVLAAALVPGLLIHSLPLELAYGAAVTAAAYPVLLVLFRVIDKEEIGILSRSTAGLKALGAIANPVIGYFNALMRYLQ